MSSAPKFQLDKVDFLTEASNRKHPTQPQLKILKEKLPELQVLPHIISSNIFRQQLINREFLEGIAQLAKDGFLEFLYSEPHDSWAMSHHVWTNRKLSKVRKWPASYIRNGRATLEEFSWFDYFRYWGCLCPSWNVVILFRCDNSSYAPVIGQFTCHRQEFWIKTSLYKTHQWSARNSHRKTRTR